MILDEMIAERKRLDEEIKLAMVKGVKRGKARIVYAPLTAGASSPKKWRVQIEGETIEGKPVWRPISFSDSKEASIASIPEIIADLKDLYNEVLHGKA